MTATASQGAPDRGERGYSLIELLVAMSLAMIVSLAALAILDFTTRNVARITEQAQVNQTGRLALASLMLELHSTCVAPAITPVRSGSSATALRFISEHGSEPSLSSVRLREIIYTAPEGAKQGTLTEKSWKSSGVSPSYTFNEAEAPTTVLLLTGVSQTISPASKEAVSVFRYYRYYTEGDVNPKYGELNPAPLSPGAGGLTSAEAEGVSKVAISFTLSPEHKELGTSTDQPIALEDSAILRLAPSSPAAGSVNPPCSPGA